MTEFGCAHEAAMREAAARTAFRRLAEACSATLPKGLRQFRTDTLVAEGAAYVEVDMRGGGGVRLVEVRDGRATRDGVDLGRVAACDWRGDRIDDGWDAPAGVGPGLWDGSRHVLPLRGPAVDANRGLRAAAALAGRVLAGGCREVAEWAGSSDRLAEARAALG